MNVLVDNSDRDGHDQLAALMAESRHPPIGETLEFHLVELDRGRVVFEGSPSRKVFNPIGSVHGGYAATMLDSACGCAVHSRGFSADRRAFEILRYERRRQADQFKSACRRRIRPASQPQFLERDSKPRGLAPTPSQEQEATAPQSDEITVAHGAWRRDSDFQHVPGDIPGRSRSRPHTQGAGLTVRRPYSFRHEQGALVVSRHRLYAFVAGLACKPGIHPAEALGSARRPTRSVGRGDRVPARRVPHRGGRTPLTRRLHEVDRLRIALQLACKRHA